jgi:hypothetical protein
MRLFVIFGVTADANRAIHILIVRGVHSFGDRETQYER